MSMITCLWCKWSDLLRRLSCVRYWMTGDTLPWWSTGFNCVYFWQLRSPVPRPFSSTRHTSLSLSTRTKSNAKSWETPTPSAPELYLVTWRLVLRHRWHSVVAGYMPCFTIRYDTIRQKSLTWTKNRNVVSIIFHTKPETNKKPSCR